MTPAEYLVTALVSTAMLYGVLETIRRLVVEEQRRRRSGSAVVHVPSPAPMSTVTAQRPPRRPTDRYTMTRPPSELPAGLAAVRHQLEHYALVVNLQAAELDQHRARARRAHRYDDVDELLVELRASHPALPERSEP